MTYLIQIEALNFGNYVYDTDDISTIRGGSLLLKKAIEEIDQSKVKPIRTGGSIGIFRMETSDKSEVEDWIKTALQECRKTAVEATFCGAFVEESADEKDFQKDLNRLQSKIRIQQLKHPTFILPGTECLDNEFCSWDGRRPAVRKDDIKGYISFLIDKRREEGKNLKKDYLNKIVFGPKHYPDKDNADNRELFYTWDLDKLAEWRSAPSNMNGKMAYIHFDGNKFGTLSKRYCKNSDKMEIFGDLISNMQETLVSEFVKSDNRSGNSKNERYFQPNQEITEDSKKKVVDQFRIEVLMWGGDEFDIIVPAWNCVEFLEHVFEFWEKQKYELPQSNGAGAKLPFTYAFGVVLCHHDAPILQVRKLADSLAYLAKSKVSAEGPPLDRNKGNAFHYLVLESIDMLAGSLDKFTDSYYGGGRYNELIINSIELSPLVEKIRLFKELFPKGKLHEMIHAVKQKTKIEEIEKIFRKALESISKPEWDRFKFSELSDRNYRELFLIVDLWDYIQPSKEDENK